MFQYYIRVISANWIAWASFCTNIGLFARIYNYNSAYKHTIKCQKKYAKFIEDGKRYIEELKKSNEETEKTIAKAEEQIREMELENNMKKAQDDFLYAFLSGVKT